MAIDSTTEKLILDKLNEIEKEISDLKLMSQETTGQMKGNTELLKLEIEHMKREQLLRDEKLEAQIELINGEVQRNKGSIAELYKNDSKQETINTKINVLFIAIGFLTPAMIYGIVQMVLIWGKVGGM